MSNWVGCLFTSTCSCCGSMLFAVALFGVTCGTCYFINTDQLSAARHIQCIALVYSYLVMSVGQVMYGYQYVYIQVVLSGHCNYYIM